MFLHSKIVRKNIIRLVIFPTIVGMACGCATHHSLISSGVLPDHGSARTTPNGGVSFGFGPERFDPLEKDPRYHKIFAAADQKTEKKLAGVPRQMGFVHLFWATKKKILRDDYGIDWKSPGELNPGNCYD